jgi:lysophospholipase-3
MYLLFLSALYAALSPIVIVPGIGGGQMRMKLDGYKKQHWYCLSDKDWFDFWVSLTYLQPENINCVNDQFKLCFDNSTGTYSNTSGVYVHPVDGLAGIEYLDNSISATKYFHDMIVALVNVGYTRNVNLQAANYDWRLGADGLSQVGYYESLKQQIESSVTAHGDRVLLVSHSLGCLVAQAFLSVMDESWIANHIQAWYPLAPPFGGSGKMAESIVSGYMFGIPDWLLPSDYFHEVQASAGSGILLLPQVLSFGADFPILTTPSKNYTSTINSMRQMLFDLNLDNTLNMFEWMRVKKAQLGQLSPPPKGLPIHLFYGSGYDTLAGLSYDKDFSADYDGKIVGQTNMDGDGTVASVSATAVNLWPGYSLGNIKLYPVLAEHMDVVMNNTVIAAILAAGVD